MVTYFAGNTVDIVVTDPNLVVVSERSLIIGVTSVDPLGAVSHLTDLLNNNYNNN